jgi:RNA polymerase sigma-70 factor, ECF subfamily
VPPAVAIPSNTAPAGVLHCRDTAFVAQTYPRVFAWFFSQTRNRDWAADLTQETFAAYWLSLRRRSVEQPVVWLFRIARNQWRLALRRRIRLRREAPLETDLSGRLAAPAGESSCGELREFVLNLPSALRDAIVLRYWCELSPAEVARVQGRPAALIRWRLHRARRLLHERLTAANRAEYFP